MRVDAVHSPVTRDAVALAGAGFRVPQAALPIEALRRQHAADVERMRRESLQLPYLREIDLAEVGSVPAFADEEPGALVCVLCRELLDELDLDGGSLPLLIDYSTVSRDRNGLSLCYRLQEAIDARAALPLAIGNGSCTSLHLAIQVALAFLASRPEMEAALLFSEDRVAGRRYYPPFNVLGDGASALVLRRDTGGAGVGGDVVVLDSAVSAMGRFRNVLGIDHTNPENLDVAEFENRIVPLHYRVIQDLVGRILGRNGLVLDDVGLFLYENMSGNALSGLSSFLGVEPERVFGDGLVGHGHIFGSDLVINFKLAQRAGRLSPGQNVLLLSSGAGFTWAATLLRTGPPERKEVRA